MVAMRRFGVLGRVEFCYLFGRAKREASWNEKKRKVITSRGKQHLFCFFRRALSFFSPLSLLLRTRIFWNSLIGRCIGRCARSSPHFLSRPPAAVHS